MLTKNCCQLCSKQIVDFIIIYYINYHYPVSDNLWDCVPPTDSSSDKVSTSIIGDPGLTIISEALFCFSFREFLKNDLKQKYEIPIHRKAF